MSTTFEAPMQNGPLDNPHLTDEENRRLDRLMDVEGMTAAEAWRAAPVRSEVPTYVDEDDVEMKRAAEVVRRELEMRPSPEPEFRPRGMTREERELYDSVQDRKLTSAEKHRQSQQDTAATQ